MITRRAFGLIGAAAVAAFAVPASAQDVITLKVADSYNPNHYISVNGTVPWMKRVEELAGGKVKFEYFPAEQLGKMADLPSLMKAGVADIVLIPTGVFAADYPLTSVATLPGFGTSSTETSLAYWDIVSKDGPVREEYASKGFRPLVYFCTPQHEIVSRTEMASLDDLKGLKVRATAGVPSQIISAIGASPVQVSPPEMYTSIERGTIDGAFVPYPSARGYKLDEVIKSATHNAALGSIVTGYSTTEATWAKLPDEVKAAFEQANREFLERITAFQDDATSKDKQFLEEKGIKLLTIDASMKSALDAAVAPIVGGWVSEMEGKGLKGQEVLDAWTAALTK
ncbi:MAG: TRAP transporter substrate-binding protein DctP [Rhizobiaceae bacterium]